jgi:predicted N-acyltransferase
MGKLVIYDSILKLSGAKGFTEEYKNQWNQLDSSQNPFVSFEFFEALENGKCLKGQSGWHPLYFTWEEDKIECALVAFIKTDSYGEFIFDWDWARAYQQYGLSYYPKLTLAIPYSPISAPKILGSLEVAKKHLIPALWDFYQKENLSGLHFLFTSQEEGEILRDYKMWERDSYQFHWFSQDCKNFDDYLKSLSKNRRKSIKRERREIQNNPNLSLQTLNGSDCSEADIHFFYECYLRTIDKKWSQAYLTKEFFLELFKTKEKNLYLSLAYEKTAEDSKKPIACALYLASKDTLFGRYWGCIKEVPFLHFELCLYRGIDLTLSLGLKKFEAGAQGEHKRLRGFKPIITKSWHHLKNESFNSAVGEFIKKESVAINEWFKA